jgi:hypothetical protein
MNQNKGKIQELAREPFRDNSATGVAG